MIFHNPGVDGFKSLSPETMAPQSKRADNGLFFRAEDSNAALRQEVLALIEGTREVSDVSITGYQAWVEEAWKAKHASADAARRFTEKLEEERDELIEELMNPEAEKDDIESELGDLLWLAAAATSNSGGMLDGALKNAVFAYHHGTKPAFYGGLKADTLPWQRVSGSIAMQLQDVTFGELDELFVAGFEPHPFTARNVFDDEATMDLYSLPLEIAVATGNVVLTVHSQWSDEGQSYPSSHYGGNRVAPAAAYLVLLCGHAARLTGSSLSGVAAHNIRKLSQRIAHNRIDKTDGSRSLEMH